MAATHEELLERFLHECGRENPNFLKTSQNLFVDSKGFLVYHRAENGRTGWGGTATNRILLGKFVGHRYKKHGLLVLNGDALEDDAATRWQVQVRNRARTLFGENRVILLPYAALGASRIDIDSIKPIHITEDREVTENHVAVNVPELVTSQARTRGRITDYRPVHEALMAAGWRHYPGYSTYGPNTRYIFGPPTDVLPELTGEHQLIVTQADYNGRATHAVYLSRTVRYSGENNAWRACRYADGEWVWWEMYHQLGASVFSAEGFDGKRHRYISAFDQNEPEPLYFMAMLPDEGRVETYEDALRTLQPPLVQAAIEQGKTVHRQGDIFAVETDLTDEQVFADARSIVRRSIALQENAPGRILQRAEEGETTGRERCPCCGSMSNNIPNGVVARQALMIYGTGHTADHVVVRNDGVTFIKGTMYHDPQLEEPDRDAEHRNVLLATTDGTRGKWYLAVRNTVPRLNVDKRDSRAVGLDLMPPVERRQARARMRRLRMSSTPAT